MRSVYECGCIDGDVSPIAKCPTHSKLVISRWNVESPVSKIWKADNVTLVCKSLSEAICKVNDSSISIICTYPNQSEFFARKDSHIFSMPDTFFKHYYRILKQNGIVILFVEQSLIASVLYCAHSHNFHVNSISSVELDIGSPDCYHTQSTKLCLVLSKGHNDLTIGNFKFRSSCELFEHIGTKGIILDPTCLFKPIVLNAVRTNRVIGLCYDFENFKSLVTKLRIDHAT